MPVAHLHTEITLDKKGTAPVEMQLLPPGEPLDNGFSRVSARDGRSFTVPAHEQLVAAFTRKIPIDVGHLTQLGLGAESGAVGWIHGLEARETGLWAVGLEWLNDGREHVETKRFARQSPTLGLDPETGFVSMVLSAALTNDPALTLVELAERQEDCKDMTTPPNPLIAHLCSELRIPIEGANVSGVLAAARVGYVLDAELCSANARAEKAESEVAQRDHEMFAAKGIALIGAAVKDGRVSPAERDYYLSMCTSNEGLAKTEAHLATLPKRDLESRQSPEGAPPTSDDKCPDRVRAMCTALDIDPDAHWARVQAKRNK